MKQAKEFIRNMEKIFGIFSFEKLEDKISRLITDYNIYIDDKFFNIFNALDDKENVKTVMKQAQDIEELSIEKKEKIQMVIKSKNVISI